METDLLIDHDTTLVDVDYVLDPPPARAWFEAPAAFGLLRLSLAGAPRHAADAAIALARCESLLEALDAWFGSALAWRWIDEPEPTPATHACACWEPDGAAADPDDSAVRLELPRDALRALPAPADALAAQLHWLPVAVVLAVSQLRLDADELALLEPGGAVVLPESIQPSWHGLLRALDEPAKPGRGVPVALASPNEARRLKAGAANGTPADDDDSIRCEVRVAPRHPLPGDRLAGWFEGDLGQIGPRASLWRCATATEPARPLAGGRLMPWGDGWALALETLCEHASVAAIKA
jgi:hypothetical protein